MVDPRSLNLRNRAAHGLDPETPYYQFVVLFHIAGLLACVSRICRRATRRQTAPSSRVRSTAPGCSQAALLQSGTIHDQRAPTRSSDALTCKLRGLQILKGVPYPLVKV